MNDLERFGENSPYASPQTSDRLSPAHDPLPAPVFWRGVKLVFQCAFVFAALGAFIGLTIGFLAPDYYNAVFGRRAGELYAPGVGLGLGLTQGLGIGIGVGLVVVLATAWSHRRRHS